MATDYVHFHGVKSVPKVATPQRSIVLRRGPEACEVEANAFFSFLFSKAGLDLDAYRGKTLNRRIPACMRFLSVSDLEEARRKLIEKPKLVSSTLTVALLGVTDFYRDASVFSHLRDLVTSELIHCDVPLRIWSAACSDGRELYSVAILLKQAGLLDKAYLLGTDCRSDAIRQARTGLYPSDSVRDAYASWLNHFDHGRKTVQLSREIRDHVCWMEGDLLQRVEPGPWDVVLWRNMAIYLQPESARKIWHRLVAELAPGGYIISGRADYAPPELDLRKIAHCIYQKKCPILHL